MPKVYWLKENCLFVQVDDKAIILDIEERTHYLPNPTAAFILQFMVAERGIGHNDLKRKLIDHYGISDQEASAAIETVLNKTTEGNRPLIKRMDGHIPPIHEYDHPIGGWKNPRIDPHGTRTKLGNIVIQRLVY